MLGLFSVLCPCHLGAKEKPKPTKTVSGIVTDQGDNPVNGATVELSDVSAGKKYAKYTQAGGNYQFADLDPKHDYEVQASYKGKSSDVRRASSLDSRSKIVLNLTLGAPQAQ